MNKAVMNELPEDELPSTETTGSETGGEAPVSEQQAAEPLPKAPTVGQQLAAAREAKEWSIGYVAGQLNLAPRQIQALETDNYAALPGLVSVRGFIRSYAKLLKIDASPLVATISGEQAAPAVQLEPKRSLSAMPFSDNLLMSDDRRRSPRAMLIAAVVVVLALAAIAVEWGGVLPTMSQSLSSQLQDIASTKNTIAPEASAESTASTANPPVATPDADSTSARAAVITADSGKLPSTAAPAADSAPVRTERVSERTAIAEKSEKSEKTEKMQPVPQAALVKEPVAEKSPGTKSLLVLKAREDSWIEVKAGSTTLFSRLVKAGSTESVEISEPVVLTLGNAAGVDAVFRGSPLDVKTDAKSNVLRLSLK